MSNPLGFTALTEALASIFEAQYDERQAGKVRYELSDAGLAAFAVFFTQSPSFLAYQRDMEKRKGQSNAQTLFGMKQIPSDTHVRNPGTLCAFPARLQDTSKARRTGEVQNEGTLARRSGWY